MHFYLFALRFSILLNVYRLLSKTVRVTYNWDHTGDREGWSGLFLTKSTCINVIFIVIEKAV